MKRRMLVCLCLLLSGVVVYAGVTAFVAPMSGAALLASGSPVPGVVNHQGVIAVNGTRFNGVGQFRFAIVNTATGLNLWTNDGTQLGTTIAPAASVSLSVSDGIYNVPLGDTSLTNMTTIAATVFTNSATALRIWFDDGINGSQQLSPDHKLRTASYAFRAEAVTSNAIGTVELADSAVTAAKLGSDVPLPPIGSVIAWHKSLSGTPALPNRWVECNGQTLSDAGSPYNGQTIPDLNGQARFLRGSSTSGTLQADQFQTHGHAAGTLGTASAVDHVQWSNYDNGSFNAGSNYWGGRQGGNFEGSYTMTSAGHTHTITGAVGSPNSGNTGSEARPINMSVVWIMRVK